MTDPDNAGQLAPSPTSRIAPRSSIQKVHDELTGLAELPQEELLSYPMGGLLAMAAPALPVLGESLPADPAELDGQLAGAALFLLSLRSDDAPALVLDASGNAALADTPSLEESHGDVVRDPAITAVDDGREGEPEPEHDPPASS